VYSGRNPRFGYNQPEIHFRAGVGCRPRGKTLVVREIRRANGFTTGFENTILAALTLRAVKDSAKKSGKLIKGAKEIYYPGTPHGLTATHQDQVNADLLGLPPKRDLTKKAS
jgi:hypothetical protein